MAVNFLVKRPPLAIMSTHRKLVLMLYKPLKHFVCTSKLLENYGKHQTKRNKELINTQIFDNHIVMRWMNVDDENAWYIAYCFRGWYFVLLFHEKVQISPPSVGHIAKYGSQKHSVYMGMTPNNRQREKKVDQHVDVWDLRYMEWYRE